MIEICEDRIIQDLGQALDEFGTPWVFVDNSSDLADAINPAGEQLYAQMMEWA